MEPPKNGLPSILCGSRAAALTQFIGRLWSRSTTTTTGKPRLRIHLNQRYL